jgi:DNA polymerase III sliding clamp (beta) subunit (PCNA family)
VTVFTVSATALSAINKWAASKEKTRHYLNGVCLQVRGSLGVLVATDGIKLLAHVFDAPQGAVDQEHIIPSHAIAELNVRKRDERTVGIAIEGTRLRLEFGSSAITGKTVDGTFPDWRRVIPLELSGDTAQFDPQLLKDMRDAGAFLGLTGRMHVGHNGRGPAWVNYGDSNDLFGVVCPIAFASKEKSLEPHRPSWTK